MGLPTSVLDETSASENRRSELIFRGRGGRRGHRFEAFGARRVRKAPNFGRSEIEVFGRVRRPDQDQTDRADLNFNLEGYLDEIRQRPGGRVGTFLPPTLLF